MKIPRIEYAEMTPSERTRFFPFENMRPMVVPARIGFAIAYDSSKGYYMGVVISNNGEQGYRKRKKEQIFVRTCETSLAAGIMRNPGDIVAKLA